MTTCGPRHVTFWISEDGGGTQVRQGQLPSSWISVPMMNNDDDDNENEQDEEPDEEQEDGPPPLHFTPFGGVFHRNKKEEENVGLNFLKNDHKPIRQRQLATRIRITNYYRRITQTILSFLLHIHFCLHFPRYCNHSFIRFQLFSTISKTTKRLNHC